MVGDFTLSWLSGYTMKSMHIERSSSTSACNRVRICFRPSPGGSLVACSAGEGDAGCLVSSSSTWEMLCVKQDL